MDRRLAFICAFGATALFGFIGLFNRDLSASGLSSIQVSFIRLSVTSLIFLIIMLMFSRSAFRIRRNDLWLFILMGLTKLGADIFFLRAQVNVSLSLATVLQNMAPYFVLAISFFLFKEKISPNKIIAVVVGTMGCVLIIGLFDSKGVANPNGILSGLVSAACIAVFYLCGKVLADREYKATTVMFYGFTIGAVILALFADLPMIASTMSNNTSLITDALALGIVCTAIPYFLTQVSYGSLDAGIVSVIGLCEVLFSALVGFIFFDEQITVSIAAGMILVCLSVLILDGTLSTRMLRKTNK